jgi:hypothetical protein
MNRYLEHEQHSCIQRRLSLRNGRRTYIFCLALLWALIMITLVLDWVRSLHLHDTTSVAFSDFTVFDPFSWDNANDMVSTLIIVIADALLVSQGTLTLKQGLTTCLARYTAAILFVATRNGY